MKKATLLILLFLSIGFHLSAQHTLFGNVRSKGSSNPIPSASVYINNTSIGTSSNAKGDFSIANISSKNCEVVVTAIGYETVSLQVQLPVEKGLTIEMVPKAKEIEEIVVLGYVQDGWKKWGLFFTESIIGLGFNAEETKIENPDVVRFRYDKKAKILTAICAEPLKITNNHLGYKLTYDLTNFQMDFNQHSLYFEGFAFFEDIGKGKQKFKKARKDTYDVSLMKFIRSTYQLNWEKEGYIVRKLVKKDNEVRLEAQAKYKALVELVDKKYQKNWKIFYAAQKETRPEHVQILQNQMRQPEQISYLMNVLSPKDIIRSEDHNQQLKEIKFNDFLYVIYPASFQNSSNKLLKAAASQDTEIVLSPNQHIFIDANGNFFPANHILFSGYMVNLSKLAFLLPLDYQVN